MFLILRSSTRITSNRRAISVLVFSAQSLRLSVSRALSRAMESLTRLRRLEPRRALASLRSRRSSRLPLPHGEAGNVQQFTCRQGRGDGYAAVDAYHLAVARRRDLIGDGREGDMPASRPVQVTR